MSCSKIVKKESALCTYGLRDFRWELNDQDVGRSSIACSCLLQLSSHTHSSHISQHKTIVFRKFLLNYLRTAKVLYTEMKHLSVSPSFPTTVIILYPSINPQKEESWTVFQIKENSLASPRKEERPRQIDRLPLYSPNSRRPLPKSICSVKKNFRIVDRSCRSSWFKSSFCQQRRKQQV